MAKCDHAVDEGLPNDLELVIDFRTWPGGETYYNYYLVSWSTRVVMWVDDVDQWYLTANHREAFCPAHLRECFGVTESEFYLLIRYIEYAMDWQFWYESRDVGH